MAPVARPAPPPAPYHHGDLRAALIGEALAAGSLETMSLRQLAQRVGVTPAAVYRHFQGKDELLLTLAALGFERLHVAFTQAFDIAAAPADAAEARQRLLRLGVAYLAFADAEPALWRLMFGPLAAPWRSAAPPPGRPSTFDYLPAALLGLHRTGVTRRPPSDADVLFTWSAIHGMAALRDGQLPLAQGELQRAAGELVQRVIASLAHDDNATPRPRQPPPTA